VFLPVDDFSTKALHAMYAVLAKDFCEWLHVTVEDTGCTAPMDHFFHQLVAARPVLALPPYNLNPDDPATRGNALYDALVAGAVTMQQLWIFIYDPVGTGFVQAVDACYQSAAAPLVPYADWIARVNIMANLFSTGGLRYFLDEAAGFPGPNTGQRTYTVIIPPAGQGELCIAFRVKPEAIRDYLAGTVNYSMPPGFAINSFDFSQEPDHEYVELANVTDEEIDLSGWTLEIGIPDPPGATHDPYMKDPFKSVWTIPAGTRIAPQGKLLLGFNVFDGFRGFGGSGSDLVSNNGMGLAGSSVEPGLENVTVPPIGWMPAPLFSPYDNDLTGSVFYRDTTTDFIDNDGDGLSSFEHVLMQPLPVAPSPLAGPDLDNVLEEYRTHGVGDIIPAFSRMVQLQNEQLWLESDNSLGLPYPAKAYPYIRSQEQKTMSQVNDTKMLARLVLRGGALPNYPERDGIDNDGDGGYVTSDKMAQWSYDPPEPLLSYVRGTLDKDMVDNNMDGRIDECGTEMFNGMLDGFGNPLYATHGQPLLSEGVDEGHMGTPIYYPNPNNPTGSPLIQSAYRGVYFDVGMRPRMFGAGTYESNTLPVRFVINPAYYQEWLSVLPNSPALFTDRFGNPGYTPALGFPWWTTNSPAGSDYTTGITFPIAPTPGTNYNNDSQDWRTFVERRWNPGDNVMVTLYVGPASEGNIADQVTYREYDVINRTINDIAPSPYHVDGYNGPNEGLSSYLEDTTSAIIWQGGDGTEIDQNWERAGLDPFRPMFWLPDHMGLDFYRSLERKHPLYHGDRFGLANRWTPTSAAYDDWADSMSTFRNAYPRWMCFPPNNSYPGPANRFEDFISGTPDPDGIRLFSHAFYGSPLRMNTQTRIWENPPMLGTRFVRAAANGVDERVYTDESGSTIYHQFPGLNRYRDTGHELDVRPYNFKPPIDPEPTEMRQASDWSFRQAQLRNLSFDTPGSLARLPLLCFERILDFKVADYAIQYYMDCAISPINSQFVFRAPGQPINSYPMFFSGQFTYFYDSTVTSTVLAQAVEGAGLSVFPLDWTMRERPDEPEPLLADTLDTIAMNPIVLTVGQARVAPLWPGPGADYPAGSGTLMDEDMLRAQFKWSGPNNPSHMWTPVYLFELPDQTVSSEPEKPWLVADYPREIGQPAYSLDNGDGLPLITPTYMFTGRYITSKLFGILSNDDLATIVAQRWPIRSHASIIATPQDPFSPADRAVMYVSRHNVDMGDANRAEALFVWDRDSGIENGTYVVYVGTAIPGLTRKIDEAQLAIEADYLASGASLADSIPLPHAENTGGIWVPNPRTQRLLGLDPMEDHGAGDPRFETQIAMEFITDRRYAEQMQPPPPPWGPGKTDQPGMLHPRDWYPESYTVPKYTAGADGYILYSKDPNVQWQPIPVRVTDNYLALRVRNMGDGGHIACITHVVLAPAPRNRGQVNVNTAETHRIVRGVTGANWNIELFNALEGLPGVVNALNTFMDPALPPLPNEDLEMPFYTAAKTALPDPWRAPWPTPAAITGGGTLPPLMNALPYALNATATPPDAVWQGTQDGLATLNLTSLIAENRIDHPDGRFYSSPAELLSGIYVGGIDRRDRDGTWPLSNLGKAPLAASDPNDVANPAEARFEEILERFSRMSNMLTTRSDVFEIIATVQAGTAADNNADGVSTTGATSSSPPTKPVRASSTTAAPAPSAWTKREKWGRRIRKVEE